MEYTQPVLFLFFSVMLDSQSVSSVTPAHISGMTSKLCSLRHIAASFVRLLILQRED